MAEDAPDFGNESGIMAIGADAPGNARAVKMQRFDSCCSVPADRHCHRRGTMPVAVLGIDGDEIGLGHVGIAVAK